MIWSTFLCQGFFVISVREKRRRRETEFSHSCLQQPRIELQGSIRWGSCNETMLTITSTQTRQTMFGSKERLFKVKCLMFFWSSAFFLLFIHFLFILQLININFLRVQSFNLIHFKYYLSVTICCTDRSSLIFSEILAPWGRKRLPDLFVRYHFQNWKTYLPAANETSDGNSSASLSEISPMILRKWTESEWSNCNNISKIIEFSVKLWETLTTLWNLTREKCGKAEKMYAFKALIFTFELPRSKKG